MSLTWAPLSLHTKAPLLMASSPLLPPFAPSVCGLILLETAEQFFGAPNNRDSDHDKT